MTEMYDIKFGIYNHIANKHPLGSVLLHKAEDTSTRSLTYSVIDKYRKFDVYSVYRISLVEFLSLPPDIVKKILEDCEEVPRKQAKENEELAKILGK